MEYVHSLIALVQAHPLAILATLSLTGAVLKKFKPRWRLTKIINSLASDIPELRDLTLSLMGKKNLLRALELAEHVIDDVKKAAK